MGDMRDVFEGYKDLHKQRVAKNPQRLEYAKKLLTENGITFKVCNEQTGQINCYFANGTIYTFYAGTGKIQGYKNLRGIHNFVRLCKKEIKANESSDAKFIKDWNDLVGLESETHRLEIDVEKGCGWILPKKDVGDDEFFKQSEYLSTHTFYGKFYSGYTKILQSFGFNVVLDNWDKEQE